MRWITERGRHAHDVLFRPMWSWGWVGVVGFVGSLSWLRDEFVGEALQNRFKIVNLLPTWGWETWALVWAAALAAVLFEGSFRNAQRLRGVAKDERGLRESYWEALQHKGGSVPIEHVFYWIDLEVIEVGTWEMIGNDLIDKLHTGQLRVWGRPISQQGKVGPLSQISPLNWATLRFSYLFFLPNAEGARETYNPTKSGTEYTGLVFNAAEIESFWPAPVPL